MAGIALAALRGMDTRSPVESRSFTIKTNSNEIMVLTHSGHVAGRLCYVTIPDYIPHSDESKKNFVVTKVEINQETAEKADEVFHILIQNLVELARKSKKKISSVRITDNHHFRLLKAMGFVPQHSYIGVFKEFPTDEEQAEQFEINRAKVLLKKRKYLAEELKKPLQEITPQIVRANNHLLPKEFHYLEFPSLDLAEEEKKLRMIANILRIPQSNLTPEQINEFTQNPPVYECEELFSQDSLERFPPLPMMIKV